MKKRQKMLWVSAFLTAMRMKGETVQEIASFAKIMREYAVKIYPKVKDAVDTCGTGGDRIKTFNISTISAFVIAASGVPVAKHGNRAVTSKTGSADLLESFGIKIDVSPKITEKSIEKIGIGFLFAPIFHKAMKNVAKVRNELKIRTVFNILGPLTNPANVKRQVLGVFSPELTEKIANVLKNLGCERALVVHGMDGIDEISTIGKTKISELKNRRVETYFVEPEEFGIRRAKAKELRGGDIEYNKRIALELLKGRHSPMMDAVLLNSAAGLYVGDAVKTIEDGIDVAKNSIESGKAIKKLNELREMYGKSQSEDMRNN